MSTNKKYKRNTRKKYTYAKRSTLKRNVLKSRYSSSSSLKYDIKNVNPSTRAESEFCIYQYKYDIKDFKEIKGGDWMLR